MRVSYFNIPAIDSEEEAQALNQFLAQRKVVKLEQQLVDCGVASYWAVSVQWLAGGRESAPKDARERVDYMKVLPADEFAVFAQLRDLRKALAAERAVPLHSIFSNEQLASMVRDRVSTRAALLQIPGVGDAKVRDYGEAVLALLQRALPSLKPSDGGKP